MSAVLEHFLLVRPTQKTKLLSVTLQVFQQSRLFSSKLSQWLWMWTGGCEQTDGMKKAHWLQCLEGVQRQGINAPLSFCSLG